MNKKLKILLTLLVVGSCWSIVYLIPFIQYVYYTPFKDMIGISNLQMGFLMTIYGLGNVYGSPIGGWVADRFNHKKVYVGSLVVNGILGIIFVMNPTYTVALIVWVLFSIAGLLMNLPAHIKIVRNLSGDEDQGKLFGFNETAIGIGNIVFNAVMMFMFVRYMEGTAGLKAAIVSISVMSLLLTIPAWLILDDPDKENEDNSTKKVVKHKMDFQDYMTVIKSPATWLLGLSIFSIYSYLTTMTYFTPYFTDVIGVDVTYAGWVAIVRTYVMTLIGAPIGGFLADKLKSPAKVLLGVTVMGLLGMSILLNIDSSISMSFIIVLTLMMALGVFMGRGCYFAVISELKVPAAFTASTVGFAAIIGYSPDIFQFILFGHWLDKYQNVGYTYMFIYQAIVLVIGVITALTVIRRNKKNSIDSDENQTKLKA